jgi:hypothetical protein
MQFENYTYSDMFPSRDEFLGVEQKVLDIDSKLRKTHHKNGPVAGYFV